MKKYSIIFLLIAVVMMSCFNFTALPHSNPFDPYYDSVYDSKDWTITMSPSNPSIDQNVTFTLVPPTGAPANQLLNTQVQWDFNADGNTDTEWYNDAQNGTVYAYTAAYSGTVWAYINIKVTRDQYGDLFDSPEDDKIYRVVGSVTVQ